MPIKNIQTWKELSKKGKKPKKGLDLGDTEEEITEEVYKEEEPEIEEEVIEKEEEKKEEFEVEEKKPKKKLPQAFRVRWLVLIIFIGAVISWSVGWWLYSVSEPSQGTVTAEFIAPQVITSGEEVELILKVVNNEKVEVKNSEVTFQWPEGVRVVEGSEDPLNDSMTTWLLPDIVVGGEVELKITLQVFGDELEQKNIGATMVYELANFSSVFYADVAHTLSIGLSKLAVEVQGEDEISPLKETEWRFAIENLSEEIIEDGVFEVNLPSSVGEIITVPEADVVKSDSEVRVVTKLEDFSPQEKTVFKIKAMFDAGSQGSHDIVWKFGERVDQDVHITQEGDYNLYVIGDEVEVKILVNKKEGAQDLNWGDQVEVELIAKNITSGELINGEWSVDMTGEPFDWNTLATPFSVVQERPGVLLIKPSENVVLQSFLPGEEKRVSFKVNLKSQESLANNVNIKAKFQTQSSENSNEKISFSREVKDIKIMPIINWHSSAHYFDDEGVTVGNGPLPPKVGQATTYRIEFNISEAASNVDRVVVSTVLSPDSLWANQFDANFGIISYQPTSRQVQWILNNVDSYDASTGELYAYFDIRLVPNQDDLGNTMPLTGSIQLQAFRSDNTAKAMSNPRLSTGLEGDIYAQGKGVVEE